jgi:hypothetical protein
MDLVGVLQSIEQEEEKSIAAIGRQPLTVVLNRLDRELREYERQGIVGVPDPNDPATVFVQIIRSPGRLAATTTSDVGV